MIRFGFFGYSMYLPSLRGYTVNPALLPSNFVWLIQLTSLHILLFKVIPLPSILLHVPDGTTRKILILSLQEIKRDIIFRRAQLAEPRRREELLPRIQAHLLSVISKLQSFLEYQGVLNFTDALALLRCMAHSTLHD